MNRQNRFAAWPMLIIMLLAFALRMWGLADHSIWWDEGRSASMARFPYADIVRQLAAGNHPPLHYFVLRSWWLLVGDGEFVMRFSSVLFGLLWLSLAYRLAFIVGGKRPALMSALFLAISRFAIVWSQQVRMYTWSAMWATLVLIASLSFWRKKQWLSFVIYVIAAVSAIFSLYLTVSSVVTVNLVFLGVWFLLGKQQRLLIQWTGAQFGVLLIVLPWLLLNASQAETWTVFEPMTLMEYARLYASMLVIGNPLDLSATLPYTLAALGVFVGSIGIVTIWQKKLWSRIGLTILWSSLVVQAVVVYAICFGIVPGFARPLVPRYLLLLSTSFYVIVGWGLSSAVKVPWLKKRRSVIFAAAGLFLIPQLIGLSTLYPGRVRRDDYVSIASALRYLRHPGDAVLLYVDRDWPVFEAHYDGKRYNVSYLMDINGDSVDALLSQWWFQHDAVWVVTTPEALQVDPDQQVPQWLEKHAQSFETIITGENKLTLYFRNLERQELANAISPEATKVKGLPESSKLADVILPLHKYRTGDTIHLGLVWSESPNAVYFANIVGTSFKKQYKIEPQNHNQEVEYSYQLVDIILEPGMPGGLYSMMVLDDLHNIVTIQQFSLIQAAAGLDIPLTQIPNPLSVKLGESINLIGYTLSNRQVYAGNHFELTLYWRTDSPLQDRYKVFTHILGQNFNASTGNFLWGQVDSEPGKGQALTPLWTPGSVIVDPYDIQVDPLAPPGKYIIEVGMYGLVDVLRLQVESSSVEVADNAIHLTTIEVVHP